VLAALLTIMIAATPDAEVTKLVAEQVVAWNNGDLAFFCALYAEDAIFLSPSGVTRGRKAVEERYAKKYGGNKKGMGTLAIEPLETRVLGTAVTIAAKWTLTFEGKPPASGHTLIVFERRADRWVLVQDASM
jgi:uncharacterized protein (TIGR02246 family)